MTFDEFKNNVQRWAAERGIYEHSTTEAQLMKALSELGELADAIIKGDDEALKDAVGDVAVCIVNAAYLEGVGLDIVPDLITAIEDEAAAFANDLPQYVVGWIAWGVGSYLSGDGGTYDAFVGPMHALATLCKYKGLDFMDCCEHAWNEIKDRRGFLSPSGAFIKQE